MCSQLMLPMRPRSWKHMLNPFMITPLPTMTLGRLAIARTLFIYLYHIIFLSTIFLATYHISVPTTLLILHSFFRLWKFDIYLYTCSSCCLCCLLYLTSSPKSTLVFYFNPTRVGSCSFLVFIPPFTVQHLICTEKKSNHTHRRQKWAQQSHLRSPSIPSSFNSHLILCIS